MSRLALALTASLMATQAHTAPLGAVVETWAYQPSPDVPALQAQLTTQPDGTQRLSFRPYGPETYTSGKGDPIPCRPLTRVYKDGATDAIERECKRRAFTPLAFPVPPPWLVTSEPGPGRPRGPIITPAPRPPITTPAPRVPYPGMWTHDAPPPVTVPTPAPVPLPASVWLLAAGLLCLRRWAG